MRAWEHLHDRATRAFQKGEIIMHLSIAVLLATSLVSLTGCGAYVKQSDVCTKGYYGYSTSYECPTRASAAPMVLPVASNNAEARILALEKENQRLTAELNALQYRTTAP